MKEGTQYWVKKFMEGQADYFKEAIYNKNNAGSSFNKEEKMLHDANKVLKADENEADNNWYMNGGFGGLGVFANQGRTLGDAPCTTPGSYNVLDNDPGCGTYAIDLINQIKRK